MPWTFPSQPAPVSPTKGAERKLESDTSLTTHPRRARQQAGDAYESCNRRRCFRSSRRERERESSTRRGKHLRQDSKHGTMHDLLVTERHGAFESVSRSAPRPVADRALGPPSAAPLFHLFPLIPPSCPNHISFPHTTSFSLHHIFSPHHIIFPARHSFPRAVSAAHPSRHRTTKNSPFHYSPGTSL